MRTGRCQNLARVFKRRELGTIQLQLQVGRDESVSREPATYTTKDLLLTDLPSKTLS